MNTQLQELCELDQLITFKLEFSEINAEEITQLVDNREQLLQNVPNSSTHTPTLKQFQMYWSHYQNQKIGRIDAVRDDSSR